MNFDKKNNNNLFNDEPSCLEQLRSTPLSNRSAAAMAHSGIILPKKRRFQANSTIMDSSEMLRLFLFVNMIENLCVGNDGISYDQLTCKCLVRFITKKKFFFFIAKDRCEG